MAIEVTFVLPAQLILKAGQFSKGFVWRKMQSAQYYRQSPIHVLVGDNSRIHSHLLADALKRDHRLLIVGSASGSREFLESAARQIPDVVIISAHLDDDPLGGIIMLREFHKNHPTIPAVMLLDAPKREVVLDAFRAGARGIFHNRESLKMLCKCVRVVHEGQVWASSSEITFALEALSSVPTSRCTNVGGLNLLSPRELEIVNYLAEGLTNREIAERLGLSRHTVKNYLLKIFDKLGVSNRVELVFLKFLQPAPIIQSFKESESPKKIARETVEGREMRKKTMNGTLVLEG